MSPVYIWDDFLLFSRFCVLNRQIRSLEWEGNGGHHPQTFETLNADNELCRSSWDKALSCGGLWFSYKGATQLGQWVLFLAKVRKPVWRACQFLGVCKAPWLPGLRSPFSVDHSDVWSSETLYCSIQGFCYLLPQSPREKAVCPLGGSLMKH